MFSSSVVYLPFVLSFVARTREEGSSESPWDPFGRNEEGWSVLRRLFIRLLRLLAAVFLGAFVSLWYVNYDKQSQFSGETNVHKWL